MNPVLGLSLGRIAVGVVAVANPQLAARTLQLDPVSNPQVTYVTRLFGVREIALGAVTLAARSKKTQRGLIGAGILVDAGDAVVGYLAIQDGILTKKAAMTLIAPAVGAVGSGIVGLFRR